MTDRPTTTTDRPVALRPAAPTASVDTPTDHQPTDTTATRPTAHKPTTDRPARRRLTDAFKRRPTNTNAPTVKPTGDRPTDHSATDHTRPTPTDPAPTPTEPTIKPVGRVQQWRDRKSAAAADRQTRTDQTRAAAIAAATHRATDRPTTTHTDATEDDIAPVPTSLKWVGIWLDRTFGAIPLAAPLIVSGAYTMQVFTDKPIEANPLVALAATCALEGGVWKLSRLYEKTLVAGDSTMALRLGIGFYLSIISGLIYWHADHQAQVKGHEELGADALPAFGVAVMSALGVYIWSRTARWMRRRELHAAGRIDTQAPKFAALSWVLCPIETPKALRHAVKYRIDSPVEAVEDRRLYVAAGKPAIWPPTDRPQPPTDLIASIAAAGRPTDLYESTDLADQPTDQDTQPTDRTDRTGQPQSAPTAVDATDRPAQPTGIHTDRIAIVIKPPTDHTAPTVDRTRPTTTNRPAIPAPRVQPARPANDTSTDRPAFSSAAIENAAIIRDHLGDPTDRLKLADVRNAFDPRWSYDKANPAFKAYLAGADLTDQPTDQKDTSPDHATDRPAVNA